MSLATSTTTTMGPGGRASRRSLIGGAAVAFSAAASAVGITAGFAASVADLVPSVADDAALLAICASAEKADRLMMEADRQHALHGRTAVGTAARRESDDHFDEFVKLADEAALVPAQTMAGLRAKARVVFLSMNTTLQEGDITSVMLRDIGWGA